MIAKKLVIPGVIGLATIAGAGATAAFNNISSVDAATSSGTSTTTQSAATQQTPPDPTKGGHIGANGTKEELLTGDTAAKATAAAKAAEPGATIIRVETDAEGAKYEAHMKKSDGSMVTVKMDANFKVTSVEDGMGGGPDINQDGGDSGTSSSNSSSGSSD
ncbi:MAG TPA: hypothetical protein VLG47_04250 [Candidatus Saccharimonadales bacterium]|nr:hypothetical protein [Candidatus Saccharimonadales bacterium]